MAITQDTLEFRYDENVYQPVMIWDDDAPDPLPVVMVCGTIYGRNDFVIERARELARLGYVGVALDVYGNGFATDDVDAGRSLMTPLLEDREELRERLATSLDFIRDQPNVDEMKMAVLGYCFGGLCALDVARSRDDVAAVASFHGALKAPPRQLATPINAKVLIMHGHADALVTMEDTLAVQEELTAREADWQLHTYGFARHSFAVPGANAPDGRTRYNEQTDVRSWASLKAFLNESL
ncbi:MAG: dienelactone hydrolase family protein [Gammaproteobacteria bacterium]